MYRFSTSLPYLLAQLGVRMGELFGRELARDGLTLPMYRVLAALAEQGTPQRLGELAALTSVEASTLSRLLGQMQRMGLVTRERPETNQRSLAVDLAPRGIALAARLIPRAAHYEEVATGDMPEQEAALLKAMLLRVDANLVHLERELDRPAPAEVMPGTAGQKADGTASRRGTMEPNKGGMPSLSDRRQR